MHGVVFTDATLSPLTNLITWQDQRSLDESPAGTWLEQFRQRCPAEAVERTGCRPSPGYLAVTLFTLLGQKRLPTHTRHALLVADWAVATLTASSPVTDRTNAASTGVFDLERDEWSELLDATGLPRELFPQVIESGTIIGSLTSEFAKRSGLPPGLPVAAAVGDHQAAVLGSLPAGENALHVNIGTGGQVSLPLPQFLRTPTSDTRSLPKGRFLLVGAGFAGGDAYAWVGRTAASWCEALGATPSEQNAMERLNGLAAAIPAGCNGLVCEPFFRGTRREPNRRGLFSGISSDNFTPGHVARAVLEGIATALAAFVDEQRKSPQIPREFTRVIATGNAVRRNRVLADSLERAFGTDLFVPEQQEEAAYGAAVLAGVGAGLWRDLNQVGECYRLRRVGSGTGEVPS